MKKSETLTLIKSEILCGAGTVEFTCRCDLCGEEDEVEILLYESANGDKTLKETVDDAVELFYDAGWRQGSSKKFEMCGLLCPACKSTPDYKREG